LLKKFLIVDLTAPYFRHSTKDVIGAGARTIAGILEERNLGVKIMDRMPQVDRLQEVDVLMVSGMSINRRDCIRLINLWRRVSKSPAILGGPIACDPSMIRYGFNLAIIGEGEKILEALLENGLSDAQLPEENFLKNLRGISFISQDELIVNPLAPTLTPRDWSKYSPSFHRIKDYRNYRWARVYVEVVRGCSNSFRTTIRLPDGRKCTFCNLCRTGSGEERWRCPLNIPPGCGYCSVPSFLGPSKSRRIDSIAREVSGLVEEGVRRVVLSGSDILEYGRSNFNTFQTDPENPPPDPEALEELLSTVSSIICDRAVVMAENLKANLLNEEIAKILGKYLKDTPIHIGVETGSKEYSKALGRPSTPSDALKAIKLLKKYGLRPYIYFLHGLPEQPEDHISKSIELMEKCVSLGVEKITVYRFRALPMSAFSGFPSAPPSRSSPTAEKLVSKATSVNREAKKRLLNKIVDVVVGDWDGKHQYLYPLRHGPTIIVDRRLPEGMILKVRIVCILSDRLLKAELLEP